MTNYKHCSTWRIGKQTMKTSLNFKISSIIRILCSQGTGGVVSVLSCNSSFFYCQNGCSISAYPPCHNGRLRDYSTKVKMTDRIYTGDLIQDDKETLKLHPYTSISRFCAHLKAQAERLAHDTGGFIKRCRFL